MKLLLLLLALPFLVHANYDIEDIDVFTDAHIKQLAFDDVSDVSKMSPSEITPEDTYYCKVDFNFSKLRNQEDHIFRIRVQSNSIKEAKDQVEIACLDFAISQNQRNLCPSIKNKSIICIHPADPIARDIKRWTYMEEKLLKTLSTSN